MDKLKVLFHVNEPARWQRVLLNIINFIKDVGSDNAEVEVVANGDGVLAYYGQSSATGETLAQMQNLAQEGIKFTACRNALNMHNLDEHKLPPFVTPVSAGITEIARKQAQGFGYIKP